MKKIRQNSLLFVLGALAYGLIEIIWRQHTHWSMLLTGGTCFLLLFKAFSRLKNLCVMEKCVIGAAIITAVEFAVGCIVNLWLKLNVWDYSALRFNLFGQVCALYSVLWGLLCIPVMGLCKRIKRLRIFRG